MYAIRSKRLSFDFDNSSNFEFAGFVGLFRQEHSYLFLLNRHDKTSNSAKNDHVRLCLPVLSGLTFKTT